MKVVFSTILKEQIKVFLVVSFKMFVLNLTPKHWEFIRYVFGMQQNMSRLCTEIRCVTDLDKGKNRADMSHELTPQ